MKAWPALVLGWLAAGPMAAQELLVCGAQEVMILRITRSAQIPDKVFSWRAEDSPEIPAQLRGQFNTTDECKPLPDGRILITSSGDGVAVIERETGAARFWASVPNAHSAELLPGGKLVVAASTKQGGNRLAVFDLNLPGKELSSTELYSAHGVVWDGQRQRLWALGGRELRSYRWADPELILDESWPLPDPGGHDLYALDNSSRLGLSTEAKVWIFDRDKKKFSPHFDIAWEEHIKSVSIHPKTGQMVYVQADLPNWWSSKLRFHRPLHFIELPQERIYKARWVR